MSKAEVQIGELAHSEKGSFKIGPFGSSLKREELVKSGIPVAGIENVLPNEFLPKFRKFITEEKYKKLSHYSVQPGDILVTTMGTIGRASVVPQGIGTCIIDSHLFRMRVDQSKVYPPYLCFALNGYDGLKAQLDKTSRGAIMDGLNTTILKECTIPLPSLDEQRRIAAIARKCDRLRRTRRFTQQLSDTYLQSVFLEMFGDPIINSKNWDIEPLGNSLSRIESGVNFTPISEDEPASEWRILKVSAVSFGTFNPFASKPIDPSTAFDDSLIIQKGDLLMSRANTQELVGAASIVREKPPKVLLPDKLWKLKFSPTALLRPDYVLNVLQYPRFRKLIGDMASGTSGSMKNITKEDTLSLPIPVPPILIQEKFAQIVQRFEQLRTQQREADRQAEHLFQTVLHRAFRGEL